MTTYRLNEKHPVMQKLQQVFDLMDELGIEIGVDDNIMTVMCDGQTYSLFDQEYNPNYSYHSGIEALPPCCEYKLVYEKDEEQPL